MRAIILAAGRGERLRPLTDSCPKPLVTVKGKPLIVYHLERLKMAGITDIVINVSYLREKIQDYLGTGQTWGVNIAYSIELTCLEVGGGICNALPLLGQDPFWVVNSDVWTDYTFSTEMTFLGLGHLILTENPAHHLQGDFVTMPTGHLARQTQGDYTYTGISVLHPALFAGHVPGTAFRLSPLFDKAIIQRALYGVPYSGKWVDVGTWERLQNLEKTLASPSP